MLSFVGDYRLDGFTLICNGCGFGLNGTTEQEPSRSVRVEPCGHCAEAERKAGLDDGIMKGALGVKVNDPRKPRGR